MKIILLIVVSLLASASSFVVHVTTVEWLPAWVGAQMQGLAIQPSWDVRYVAGLTSIEYGLAASALYYFGRNKFLSLGLFKAALIFSVLLAAVHGAFIRQPLMDYVVGNPIHVVLVQNCFKWFVWVLMAFITVYGVEFIVERSSANKSNQQEPELPRRKRTRF